MPFKRWPFLAFTLFCFIAPSLNAAIYKWTDDSGQTHYGSMPPSGVKYQKMGGSSFTQPPTPAKATKDPASKQTNATPPTGKQAGAKEDQYTQEQHDTLCKNARKDISTLNQSGRLRVKQEDGSTKVMTDEERNKRMKTMQDMAKKHCK